MSVQSLEILQAYADNDQCLGGNDSRRDRHKRLQQVGGAAIALSNAVSKLLECCDGLSQ